MSKYIRTENAIYTFREGMKIANFYSNYNSEGIPYLIFDDKKLNIEFLGKVVKQADTIEELCDVFIIEYEDRHTIVYDDINWAIDKAHRSTTKYTIYGGIWVKGKGLIYVAKMIEKYGELELL